MTKITKGYTIGLDLGTGSVGYAVIDGEYKLVRLCKKDAWGSVLFDNAETAVKRRQFRGARRRYARRKERIRLLQELLAPIVEEVDEGFFARMKESSLMRGEGEFFRKERYNLFNGRYTDRDYFGSPDTRTVYHLRKKLMTSDEKADPRLIYLAIHHIVKYRGHFLMEGQSISAGGVDVAEALKNYFEELEYRGRDLNYADKTDALAEILKDKSKPRSERQQQAVDLFAESGYKKYIKLMVGAVLGYVTSLSGVLDVLSDGEESEEETICDDAGKELKFSFAKSDYEEKEEGYIDAAQDRADILMRLKDVYSAVMFDVILRGKPTLSDAMIDRWNKHAKDLRALKQVFAANMTKEEYKEFFCGTKSVNYVRYIGDRSNEWFKDKVSAEELYKQIVKMMEKMQDSPEKEYCLAEIAKEDFLPLINSVNNAYIPYQLNERELEAIIDKQSKHYPLLAKQKDKIMSLLTFRRPYYAGPLKGDKFGWCEQKIDGRVTPWNFFEKVNTDELAEKFITRMTSKCSIFPDLDALPRNSVLYQAYAVLNELNKIKFKEKELPVEWKKELFLDVCCKLRKVKKKDIVVFLRRKYNDQIGEDDIGGMAEDRLTSAMTTLRDFMTRLGEDFDKSKIDEYEESVRILTLFEDASIRRKRLAAQRVYTDKQIEKLAALRYTGWGAYSRKVLMDVVGANGKNVLRTMFDTNKNFNEIRFDEKLGFAEKLRNDGEGEIKKFDYDLVERLRCSPSVKKSVWNALKVVEELRALAGADPDAIYLETTFEEKEKKATSSRVEKLSELYNNIKDGEYFNSECAEVLKNKEKRERLNDDKLFLWLSQLGRCMYSGKAISFDELGECEIDHIVPRSVISNDSVWANRVLVTKLQNQIKGGRLGMDPEIVRKQFGFWNFLYKKGFIGSAKFNALRKIEYADYEVQGFVNRQLVDTSYTVKLVRDMLKRRFPGARIEGIRQSLNHAMRMKYATDGKAGFYKIRGLNDMHHAKDAYLTAVLGQFTHKGCPDWGSICKRYLASRNIDVVDGRSVEKARNGIVVGLFDKHRNIDDDGIVVWDDPYRENVFATMAKNNCIVNKRLKYQAESGFYDQTLYSPRSGKKKLIPQKYRNGKPMPPDIYGGFSSLKPAYYAIVEYEKKGKIEHAFTDIPVLVDVEKRVDEHIAKEFGEGARIVRFVYKYQLVGYNGQPCYITGRKELNNAMQLVADPKFERLLWLADQGKAKEVEEQFDKYAPLIEEFISFYQKKLQRFYPTIERFADVLEEIKAGKLAQMTAKEQIELVKNMLILTEPGPRRISIKTAKGTVEEFGRIAKTIYPDELVWIDRSVTGLRERRHQGV